MNIRRCFLVVAFSVPMALALLAAPKPVPRFDVTGHIDGLESRRVQVVARSSSRPTRSILTTSDGTFTIRDVMAGTYTIRPVDSRFRFSPTFHTVGVTHDVHGVNFRAFLKPPRKR